MSSFNKFLIIGHLGNDPVLEQTRNGRPYCKLSVATDGYAVEGGERKPFWHQVQVFGRQAETIAAYARKGRQLLLEGRMEPNVVTEADGKTVRRVFVTADRVTLLGAQPASLPSFQEELAELENSADPARPLTLRGASEPKKVYS